MASIFAFNNEDFSDRRLKFVEIDETRTPAAKSVTPTVMAKTNNTETSVSLGRKRKREREEPATPTKFPANSKTIKLESSKEKIGDKVGGDEVGIEMDEKIDGVVPVCDLSVCSMDESKDTSKEFLWVEECFVSRGILATRSGYFKSLFSQPFAEKNQFTIQIDVREGEAPLCLELLKYIYSDCPDSFPHTFSVDQLLHILLLADRFDVPTAVQAVARTINNLTITPRHCEQLLKLPESLLTSSLAQKINDTLQSQFGDFDSSFCTKHFVRLSEEAVISIISNNNLKLRSENTIWQAIEFWAKLPVGNPRGYQSSFTPHIRFPLMDVNYLLNVVKTSKVYEEFADVREAVVDAISYHSIQRFPQRQKQIKERGGRIYMKRATPSGINSSTLKLTVSKAEVMNSIPGLPNTKINDIIITHKRVFANGYAFLGVLYRMISREKRDMIVLYLRSEGIPDIKKLYLPLHCRLKVGRLQSTSDFVLDEKHPVQLVSLVDFSQLNDNSRPKDHQPYFVDGKFEVSVELQFLCNDLKN